MYLQGVPQLFNQVLHVLFCIVLHVFVLPQYFTDLLFFSSAKMKFSPLFQLTLQKIEFMIYFNDPEKSNY